MSSIELDLAPRVHSQREELTDVFSQLNALNEQYPDMRKRPYAARDPIFEAQRSALLDRKAKLQSAQSEMRKQLRQVGG